MTPVSENGPGRTVLGLEPDEDGTATLKLLALLLIALVFLVSMGLIGSHFGYKRGYAQGYEAGVLDVRAVLAPRPVITINSPDPEQFCGSYREAAARTVKLFEDFRKTEAANRANARLLGWDEGYGVARRDWERPCLGGSAVIPFVKTNSTSTVIFTERTPSTPRR